MRILDAIRKRFEPKTITDSTFGELCFRHGWWDGHLLFKPTDTELSVMVQAGEHGPTEAQRMLFSEIERRYIGLQESICDELYELVLNQQEDYRREQVWREFELEGIYLYTPNTGARRPNQRLHRTRLRPLQDSPAGFPSRSGEVSAGHWSDSRRVPGTGV